MLQVEDFIANMKNQQQKAITQFLHNLLTTYPTITSFIKYKIPFYYQHSWVCYLNPIKSNGVELVFLHGQQLANKHLLQTKGRKMVAGISIYTMEALNEEMVTTILALLENALLYDSDYKKKKH